MKVAVISHSCVVAVNQHLFIALSRIPGIEAVELLIPSNWRNEYNGADQKPTTLSEIDFPIRQHPVWKPGNVSLHYYKSLPIAAWRDFRPDVLYVAQEPWSLAHLQAVGLSYALGVPLVFHTNQNIPKRYPPPFSWFEKLAYRRASFALAYSEEARQVLLAKGLRSPSAVIPYPVELSAFYPDATARAELRASLGIAENELVIGYMGRFVVDKGLDTLVRAVARLKAERKANDLPVRVLMVGAGPEQENLQKLAAENELTEHFLWTGLVPHARAGDYMRCMDVFALPSITLPNWKEQFGRVVIEAMACKVPVVGSDSGQIPFLIKETGGGLIFPEKDDAALARSLQEVMRDPAKRVTLGEAGCSSVGERYRTEAVASRLHEVFGELLLYKQATRSPQEAEGIA